MLNLVTKSTDAVTLMKRGALFTIAFIMVVTIAQPAYVMGLVNTFNPPKASRRNVSPLDSPNNSPYALPLLSQTPVKAGDITNGTIDSSKPRTKLKELTDLRNEFSKTYLNTDGTKTMEYSTVQQNFRENGQWKEINNKLESFSELGKPGFRGKAGSAGASLKSLRSGISLTGGNDTFSLKPVGTADVQPQKEGDYTIIYKDAWPGVDLKYELRGEMVKEYTIVKNRSAQTNFDYTVTGGKVVADPETKGALKVEGVEGYQFSPLTLDVNGRGVISEERVSQAPTTTGIRVSLDSDWFKSQPDSAFPMVIDPSWTSSDPNTTYKMYKSDGYYCPSTTCYANTGSVNDGSWKSWRTFINFSYSALDNKTILSASMNGTFQSGAGGTTAAKTVYMGEASCSNAFSCYGSNVASDTGVTTNFNIDFKTKLQALVNANDFSTWWSFKGQEGSALTLKPYYKIVASITYDTPTPMSVASSPANGAIVATTQPTLQVNTVTDADGGTMQYYHRITSNPDAETGAVINSGWTTSRQWKLPENILQDGRTYYWHTYTKGQAETKPTWVRSFKVDLRTGKNSTQAYEEVGPISVDLATGNATTSANSHNISALGGDIGLTLNYNTPALVQSGTAFKTSSKYGLKGYYYNDPAGTRVLPTNLTDPSRLLMVRNDNKLTFNWGATGSASPGLPSDNFMVRWKGYITVPTGASYALGADADDGVRIKLGTGLFGADETVLDSWSNVSGNRWGTSKSLPANQPIPITVEYSEATGQADFKLLIRTSSADEQEMPATWLAPNANILPDGWELAQGDGQANFEKLEVLSSTAILSDSTGQTYEYTWKNNGYVPPLNQEATLTKNDDGTYSVIDEDGRIYVFDSEGKLKSLTSPQDDKQPSSLKYEYANTPSRLVKIVDGVNSARSGSLYYAGDSQCTTMSGFTSAPAGMLCAFVTTDGNKTTFQYEGSNLARIAQPGDDYDDYMYDNLGRITTYRDTLANDAYAYGVRALDASITTEISYDALGRVISTKAPAPTTGAAREENTLNYLTGATELHVTGASEPNGFSKRVVYDSTFRKTEERDVTNLPTYTEWDGLKDLVLSTTDETGLKTTTIYDKDDLPTDTYGPAPAAWFDGERMPIATRVNDIPRVRTGYDEGINGLAVSYYDNKKLLQTPKLNSTSIWSTNSAVQIGFADGAAPVSSSNGWSARYTGKIKLGATGNYTFKLRGDAGFRLFVDDLQIVDGWGDGTLNGGDRTITGSVFTNTEVDSSHRLRIEQYHGSNGSTNLQLFLSGPNMAETSILSSLLSPGYGLATSTTAYDSELGNMQTKTVYDKPEYGQVAKTIIDESGLNYQTLGTYESPGSGFLRQTSKTLPGGAKTDYLYYSATDTRDNPCTPEVESILQAGQIRGKSEPDPDGSGPQSARTSETVYNETGDVVANRLNDDQWTCTSYDSRGRVVSTVIPAQNGMAGRTIGNNYLVNNSPLITSTNDGSGEIISENDILGRNVKYTDAKGNVTNNVYDTYGKLTSKTSPVGSEVYEYDTFDRLLRHKLDGTTYATVTYDSVGRIAAVNYPSDLSLSNVSRDSLQRENGTTFTLADNSTVQDTVNYYVSGNIKNGSENGVSKSYAYDAIGRLTAADIGDNHFTYGFGTPDSSCTDVLGYNSDAAKNGNRTNMNVNGQSTSYCYDHADRLMSSSDPTLTNAEYDTHGNTVGLGDATHKTTFSFDASDRNTKIESGNKETSYTRDTTDRIIQRISKDNGVTSNDISYGYTSSEDNADFLQNSTGDVVQKYLTLPGDVLVTLKPQESGAAATMYSLPNLHGDIMATVDGTGTLISKFMTGAFGEPLAVVPSTIATSLPNNTATSTSFAYAGQHEKITDTETSQISGGIIQMGARVYVPTLGRFLGVDKVEGGTDNSYAYVNDSVNRQDLNGHFWGFVARIAVSACIRFCKPIARSAWGAVKKYTPKAISAVKRASGNVGRFIAKHDPLFGYKKGLLNRGPNRIGYSKCGAYNCFRWGRAGSHDHRFSIRLPFRWQGYR